ncbi:MAG: hypothetical protein IKS85_01805 [Lachnospiraceae bacterium]|nr:hypothetical protein [Lachnospiraceae bacterium]
MRSEEVVLALCDGEEEYAQLLTEYMEKQEHLPWTVHTYTDVDKLMEGEKDVDLLLVAESVFRDEIKSLSPKRLIVLNESGIVRNKTLRYVNKYQQADQLIREVLCIYLEIASSVLPRLGVEGRTSFIGFFSPVKRCLQTSFALTMAQLLAKDHRTLYLNFEYFAGNQELLADIQTRDLADLLYFLNAEKDKFSLRLQSMVKQIGPLDYVPPMKYGQNLLGITAKEWITFLQKLQELGEYEYVVMDLSECMQGLFDVMRICVRIYTITLEDRAANGKLEQYENLMTQYSYEDVLEKTQKCNLPKIRRLPTELEYYDRGELAEYVARQLRELEGT